MNHLTGNSRYAEYARVRVNSEKMFYQARVRKKTNSRASILYLNRFKLIYRHQLRPLGRRKSIAYFCRLPRGGKAYSFASLWKNRRARDLPKKGKNDLSSRLSKLGMEVYDSQGENFDDKIFNRRTTTSVALKEPRA